MPSKEYCEQLLEDENEQLDEAQDALDDYNKALDEMEKAAEEGMGGAAKAGGHALGGDWSDAWADIVDTVTARDDFRRASAEVGRARDKWEREEGQRAKKYKKWCGECGEPPDPDLDQLTDPDGLHSIEFDDDEVDPIIGHPGGRGWK